MTSSALEVMDPGMDQSISMIEAVARWTETATFNRGVSGTTLYADGVRRLV